MSAPQSKSTEEVVRFSVDRNPDLIDSGRIQDTIVRIVPDDAGSEHRYLSAILALGNDASRQTIIATAKRLVNSHEFEDGVKKLRTPLWNYVGRLQNIHKPTLMEAQSLLNEVFGREAGELASDEGFRSDQIVISDSLVLAVIAAPRIPGLRTKA